MKASVVQKKKNAALLLKKIICKERYKHEGGGGAATAGVQGTQQIPEKAEGLAAPMLAHHL